MRPPPSIDDYLSTTFESTPNLENPEAEVATIARSYLEASHAYLRELHESGGQGSVVNAMNSDLVDRLIRRLFGLAEEDFFAGTGGDVSPLCVVAVGGYARREMNIHSDVDLLFLYQDELTPHVANVAERVLYWLWDAAVTVGGAMRTIKDTIALAKQDSTVRTAVLDPRFLSGSGVLFHEFTSVLNREFGSDPERFIDSQTQGRADSHTHFGDTLYLLQPNVKDGAGGLRDYHLSYWVMQATQPSSRGLEGFLHLGLLTEEEVTEYRAALDFLWRVRNELHLIAGRKNDQMSFELQEQIALFLGYGTPDAFAPTDLPVERFMRDYYRHARAIQNYSSLVVEQCRTRVRKRPRRRKIKDVEGGFRIADGQLEIPHARQLREDPVGLLNAFAVAQSHDVDLTRKARRLIRENLDQIDDAFRRTPEARAVFERIVGAEKRVTRSLIAMNETGLLAKFLPEWDHIVCRWQHVMYHTYTVDVHSIFLVEELRRLWLGRYENRFPELTELIRSVDDRNVLFLGCLLHDIGKGFGGDHSEKGVIRAEPCLQRLGLDAERTARVQFLVKHHLLMSYLAQRRDLSDAKLLLDFANTVGDRTNLRNLYLLTFADVRASSSTAWSDWKGQLLRELFERTAEVLETGADTPGKAIELIEKRVDLRREGAASELAALGVSQDDIQAFFDAMPRRYFTAHTPQQIARHARVALELAPDQLLSSAVREMRGDFSEYILCTEDSLGLYSKVAGVMTAHGLNILGAHVYSTRAGLALEVYRVSTPPGGNDERRIHWGEVDASLRGVLEGEITVQKLVKRRGRPIGFTASPHPEPVSVNATNEESDFYTIIDVEANDRLGLLHDLTRVIAEHGCEIYISKAATILDQVADTFYLKDRHGKKLQDEEAIEKLRLELLEVAQLGEFSGGT
ncbi:MAG: [protein-PII] uridylyltransferase [Myxococcales bacterium]|nr:[protein-PII] uridylyltransferase [Myxococcales bacterium]